MHEQGERFSELMALTRAMMISAERGEWEEVSVTETRRAELLRGFDAARVDAASLQELTVLNARLLELACAERDEIGQVLKSMRTARKIECTYLDPDI